MVVIRPFLHLAPDALGLITGYVSPSKYVAAKTETREQVVITLQLVPLAEPYIKHWEPLDEETHRRYERALESNLSLDAFEGEGLVGIAIAEPQWWNRSLRVWEFHVAKTHRRQGIGRRLMDALSEKARGAGLRTIVCETQNTNVPAIDFYRQVGFRIEGVDVSYYTNQDVEGGEVAVFMKKRMEIGGQS